MEIIIKLIISRKSTNHARDEYVLMFNAAHNSVSTCKFAWIIKFHIVSDWENSFELSIGINMRALHIGRFN